MNKTVRAWQVAVSLFRTRVRTISPYHFVLFPLSRLPFRLIIENPEELWFSWTGPRLSLTPRTAELAAWGLGRKIRRGYKNTRISKAPPLSRECGTRKRETVRDERWNKTKGWTKSGGRPLSTRAHTEFVIESSFRESGIARACTGTADYSFWPSPARCAPSLFYES